MLDILLVYNAGLKVYAAGEILTVVMTSYYENVFSCKKHRHTAFLPTLTNTPKINNQ